MALKVKNNIDRGFKEKIEKCINLLDDTYIFLDYTIDFYKDIERLEYERKNKKDMWNDSYNDIIDPEKDVAGVTVFENKTIKIFLFKFSNYKSDPNEIVHLIGNLFHEVRHAWQHENGKYIEEKNDDAKVGTENYYSLPSEKDAFAFQVEQIEAKLRGILEIFELGHLGGKVTLRKDIDELINKN